MTLTAGIKLGPYEILSAIGAGGMGEVYRAKDTRLGRAVAIKILNKEHMQRFEREARAIAALNHPHICSLYDVGSDYLVMEFVEGTAIKGPLPVEEAVRLAIQIASALDEAHKNGILHRDLKPGNILVTKTGAAKLLDFGLAKLATGAELVTASTMEGTVMGTPAYMSPEQAQGKPVDARSDIFSFGAVLYEIISGNRAFEGNSTAQVLSAVLRDEPKPLQTLPQLERIVMRCLAKLPAQRFRTMAEVKEALEQVSVKADDSQPSIAVLPFADMSPGKDNEWFGDGLAEEIINALTQIQGLNVAARTSAFAFRGKEQDITKIAETLRVRTILEGSVRKSGSRIRVTAQLVNAADGYHLWSQRYDREMTDVFEIQDEIARAISERLTVTLAQGARRATSNPDAYELYLKGRYYWNQRLPATLHLAIQLFEQAIKLDPQYAFAYAGLADCYGVLRVYGWVSAKDSRMAAHAAMMQATALAPSLWEVNFSRAIYAFYFERAWQEAGPYFEKAIAINPRSSVGQAYYGLFLAAERRHIEEAVEHVTLSRQMDPFSPFIHGIAAATFFSLGKYDAAESAANRALELQPDHLLGLWGLGLALCGLGRDEEGIDALQRTVTLSRAPIFVGILGLEYARVGRLDDASRLLHELEDRSSRGEYVPAFAILSIHVGQGKLTSIRTTLLKVLEEATPPWSVLATCGRFLEAFRSDPEINRMLLELYGW